MNEQELGDWLNWSNQKYKRWDIHQNSDFLNIVFHGGTFGNFLRYFIDKFCSLTPDILEEPFTNLGTSHNKVTYSGKVLRYHPSFANDNEGKTDLPICQIIPTTELGYLYLKDSTWYRSGDMKRTIQNIKEVDITDSRIMDSLTSLYNIDQNKSIPRWIIRDWYKLEFLNLDKSTHTLCFNYFKNYPFFKKQKTFHFALESFFDYDTFIINLKSLDQYHNLQIDFTRDREMRYIFDKGFNLDKFRIQLKVVEKILDALDKKEEIEIPELTIAPEGFLYAHLEKKNDFIQMPLSRDFFKNTREIFQYIDYYPNHYRAMNPLMPTFNGVPNPFYLYANKKNSK